MRLERRPAIVPRIEGERRRDKNTEKQAGKPHLSNLR